jgi:hypothetical protein
MSQLDTSYEVSSGLLPEGDRVQASSLEGHLLIVQSLDRIDHIDTKHQADASAVVLDVWDLNDQVNYVNVCWFNGAIVDNLAKDRHLGGNPIAIKLVSKKGKTNNYLVPEAAAGQDLETAIAWLNSRPNVFEETRQQRGLGAYDRGVAAGTIQHQAPPPQSAFNAPPAAPQQQAPAPQAAPPAAPQQQYQQQAPAAPPAAPQQQYQQPPAPQDDPWASAPQQQAPAAAPEQQYQQQAPAAAPEQQYQQPAQQAGPPPVGAPMEVPQPQVSQQAPPPAPGAPAGPSTLPF